MRYVVSIVVVLLVLMGSVQAVSVTAQNSSLGDLLPAADDIGPEFVAVDNRTRTLAEQATGFSNADEAARLLAEWEWQENAFVVFQAAALTPSGGPVATIDISLTRFADAQGAATAMPYFLQDRAAVLGQREAQNLNQRPIGDETRMLNGPVEGGEDTTLFVRSGVLLMRISLKATSLSGGSPVSPEEIAQGIIDRDAPQSPSSTVMQLATDAISDTLPLDYASCFRIDGEGALDVPAVVERLATGADTSAALQALGWQGGDYRQFACDPPPGGIGWVDVSVHRFSDAASAAEAVNFFAASRAQGMDLEPAAATDLGESSAALAGPAVNGREYTLYTNNGPLLFAVTGVAPASTSDPRADVEAIAAALLAPVAPVPVQVEESPTPTPFVPAAIPPTVAPVSTSTPVPTPIPMPTATPTPLPAATLAPLPAAIPTAVVVPTEPPPPPTAAPNPLPTAIPPAISPQPTAIAGAQPSPTPRVIRPPTPVGD